MKVYGRLVFLLNLILLTIFVFSATSWAATHYVSPSGTAIWTNSVNIGTPCSLTTANSNAQAGDTVILKDGTYTSAGIAPAHTGTGSGTGRIIYQAQNKWSAIVSAPSLAGIFLDGKSWIKIDGIKIYMTANAYLFYIRNGSSYNEIINCDISQAPGGWYWGYIGSFCGGSAYTCPSIHNWIHNNIIHDNANYSGCDESSNLWQLGSASSVDQTSSYNTIENNLMYHGGHSVMETFTQHNVIRNNSFRNDGYRAYPALGCGAGSYPTTTSCNHATYPDGCFDTDSAGHYPGNRKYSHRTLSIDSNRVSGGDNQIASLFEGNRVGYASANPGNTGAENISIGGERMIVRYNAFIGADGNGIYYKNNIANYTYVYNNTFYGNGQYNGSYHPSNSIDTATIVVTIVHDNIFKNNIISENAGGDFSAHGGEEDFYTRITLANNWCTNLDTTRCTKNGDPLFTSTPAVNDAVIASQSLFSDYAGYASTALPDLTLQAGSAAKNAGTYLTTASPAGVGSTSLVVADASYFQDGTWGSDLTRIAGTMQADWIAIGTVSNVVQISSINYATNTITLASPMSWGNNAPVWLYKKSDGTRVLHGSAPDMGGAYEYTEGNPIEPSPPPSPQPLSPGNLSATASSSSQINLSWTDNSSNETGFKIERCTDAGCTNSSLIATLAANVRTYSVTGLTANTTYYYRVRAYNSAGNSGYSNTASARTLLAASLPAAPSNLTALTVSSSKINLSWTDNSNNETGFKIERCVNFFCTDFAQIASVVANTRTYTSTGLSRDTIYTYRVRSYNSAGNSDYSNTAARRTLP